MNCTCRVARRISMPSGILGDALLACSSMNNRRPTWNMARHLEFRNDSVFAKWYNSWMSCSFSFTALTPSLIHTSTLSLITGTRVYWSGKQSSEPRRRRASFRGRLFFGEEDSKQSTAFIESLIRILEPGRLWEKSLHPDLTAVWSMSCGGKWWPCTKSTNLH